MNNNCPKNMFDLAACFWEAVRSACVGSCFEKLITSFGGKVGTIIHVHYVCMIISSSNCMFGASFRTKFLGLEI